MNKSRNKLRLQRRRRVRAKVFGTAQKPRLNVYRSLTAVYGQLIDDQKGITIVGSNTAKIKKENNVKGASELGKEIAELAQKKKISEVVFDRAGYKYHGKIKALADGAREGGLKF